MAITFTEAAASELLERIEKFAGQLQEGTVPNELQHALATPLSPIQRENIDNGWRTLDEITCTTIHGFCQQLVRPYPVETGIDPGAQIIDPAAAELAFQDLMEAWLSARFGRDRSAEGLGRIPPMKGAGGDEDFFAELVSIAPDEAVDLIEKAADFLKEHRTASAPPITVDPTVFSRLVSAIEDFASWYHGCSVVEEKTAEVVTDLVRIADIARDLAAGPITGKTIAQMLAHKRPSACKKDTSDFAPWGKKGKWKDAAKAFGKSAAFGETLSAAGEAHYWNCNAAYGDFCGALGQMAFQRFVAEFTALKDIYAQYKRDAALMDFDDLLHHARDLLAKSEPVRQALAVRYPEYLSMSSKTPIRCKPKSYGVWLAREPKAAPGRNARFGMARCSLWATRNRLFIGSEAPTLRHTSRQRTRWQNAIHHRSLRYPLISDRSRRFCNS